MCIIIPVNEWLTKCFLLLSDNKQTFFFSFSFFLPFYAFFAAIWCCFSFTTKRHRWWRCKKAIYVPPKFTRIFEMVIESFYVLCPFSFQLYTTIMSFLQLIVFSYKLQWAKIGYVFLEIEIFFRKYLPIYWFYAGMSKKI